MRATLALVLLAASGPAAARPPEALACAIMAAPEGLDGRIADVILAEDPAKDQPALVELRKLVDRCGADQFLSDKEREAYFGYTAGRMARDALDARMTAAGVPAALVDRALDIGPGNANNPAEKVTQGDLRRVAEALSADGRDPAKVTPDGWRLVTGWIVATAQMFDGLRGLD